MRADINLPKECYCDGGQHFLSFEEQRIVD
jgi:hypothetical protein